MEGTGDRFYSMTKDNESRVIASAAAGRPSYDSLFDLATALANKVIELEQRIQCLESQTLQIGVIG